MHVHLNGLHILQYQNITLRLHHKLIQVEAFWDAKKKGHDLFPGKFEEIHMPNNSGLPFIMSCIFFVWGFSFVFSMWIRLSLFQQSESLLVWLIVHLKKITDIIFLLEEIEETEKKLRGAK